MKKEELFEKMKLAIENEDRAYRLYKEIAEKSGDSELKVIFERIAREEKEHGETIRRRYDILKDLAD